MLDFWLPFTVLVFYLLIRKSDKMTYEVKTKSGIIKLQTTDKNEAMDYCNESAGEYIVLFFN